MQRLDTQRYRVPPGQPAGLSDRPTQDDGGLDKDTGRELFDRARRQIVSLQEKLYADGRFGVLFVFQAMDAGGKDSTIRNVLGPVNPQGCRVVGFKAPSAIESAHDFLWRIHRAVPARGVIGVFNRSHYEDVLIARVKNLVPERVWRARFEHINAFEAMLHDSGYRVVKFMLHISKAYQKRRLQRRLDNPDKHWKFNPDDLTERARWDAYRAAYDEALTRCSTEAAPWYVVPAERRWFRNLVVAEVVAQTIASLDPRPPEPAFDPGKIVIK